ncbi:MAG: putative phage tail fiber protein [Clostridia bacterium]|jgi:hypothetical protein|nr:putative phage tail fiber protein [Clostridia bacterium]
MAYIKTNWVANETPLSPANMNKIEQGIADAHTEKVSHSLATAVNDFLVASAAGQFVKKTLAEVKSILSLGSAAYTASTDYAPASHLADYLYQSAGGTATAITLTDVILEEGHPKTFIASADNGGAATTINTKPLYKPNTTDAPNLIAGKAYTVWYNTAGDCFFIKASAEGNATAAQVLAPYTFSNEVDTGIVGTVDISQAIPTNIREGTTIAGIPGTLQEGYKIAYGRKFVFKPNTVGAYMDYSVVLPIDWTVDMIVIVPSIYSGGLYLTTGSIPSVFTYQWNNLYMGTTGQADPSSRIHALNTAYNQNTKTITGRIQSYATNYNDTYLDWVAIEFK